VTGRPGVAASARPLSTAHARAAQAAPRVARCPHGVRRRARAPHLCMLEGETRRLPRQRLAWLSW
jgi:hypothetical protein